MSKTDDKEPVVEIPWSVAILTFRLHLQAELVHKHGYTPSAAKERLDKAIDNYDEQLANLMKVAVLNSGYAADLERTEKLISDYGKEVAECIKDNNQTTGHLEAALDLHRASLTWVNEGCTYEGWINLLRGFYYHQGHKSMDTMGKLDDIANQLFALNLRPFFETHCTYSGADQYDAKTTLSKIANLTEAIEHYKSNPPTN